MSEAAGIQDDNPRMSGRFRSPDGDLIMRSSDGVLFRVHRKNLEMHSEVFPGTDTALITDEIVELPESSAVLELMFQFMYRQPQPDLSVVPFMTLDSLAESVEKYCIYSAQGVCRMQMEKAIPEHPINVLGYAVRHGHRALCDSAAPRTIGCWTVDASASLLDDRACVAWAKYRDQWLRIYHNAMVEPSVVMHKGGSSSCNEWVNASNDVMARLISGGLMSLQNADDIFRSVDRLDRECTYCAMRYRRWRSTVATAVSAIQSFVSIWSA